MRYLPLVAKMASRNVMRYGRRSVQTLIVVFVGVAAVALVDVFLNGFSDRLIEGLAVADGQLRVSAPGYEARAATCPLDKLVGDPISIAADLEKAAFRAAAGSGRESGFAAIAALPSLRAPSVLQFGDRSSTLYATGEDAMLEGRGLAPPFRTASLVTGRFPRRGERGLVLSGREASTLGTMVGDSCIVLANDAFGSFGAIELPILGITRNDPGPDPCLVDLASMRELLGVEKGASRISLYLVDADGRPLDPRGFPTVIRAMETAALAGGLDAERWDSSGNAAAALMAFYDSFIYVMYAIFVVVAASGIANSVLLSVQDRTRDFATLRAVAFSAGWVRTIVALETLIVGMVASLLALGAVLLLVTLVGPEGIPIPKATRGIVDWMPETIPARVEPLAMVLIFLGGSVSPLAAAAYPLFVIGRMKIREALGYV
jgi:putative ABC transport system permease protein